MTENQIEKLDKSVPFPYKAIPYEVEVSAGEIFAGDTKNCHNISPIKYDLIGA